MCGVCWRVIFQGVTRREGRRGRRGYRRRQRSDCCGPSIGLTAWVCFDAAALLDGKELAPRVNSGVPRIVEWTETRCRAVSRVQQVSFASM